MNNRQAKKAGVRHLEEHFKKYYRLPGINQPGESKWYGFKRPKPRVANVCLLKLGLYGEKQYKHRLIYIN